MTYEFFTLDHVKKERVIWMRTPYERVEEFVRYLVDSCTAVNEFFVKEIETGKCAPISYLIEKLHLEM